MNEYRKAGLYEMNQFLLLVSPYISYLSSVKRDLEVRIEKVEGKGKQKIKISERGWEVPDFFFSSWGP